MIWGAITPVTLILILIIVILLFGTSRLKSIGSDLGDALKNFRKSMREGESESKEPPNTTQPPSQLGENSSKPAGNVYQGEVVNKEKDKDKQA
ncbi:MAG: twin-arginine translocase TatA/TatE family subunit [Gammaproteobacteria bacterium]|nr:twin-arginine translocase TatA/TatE family subunit [Gammaproteobacteria bacterium]